MPEKRLSWGNGILELGTFLAIVLGAAAGGILFSTFKPNHYWSGLLFIGLALIIVMSLWYARDAKLRRVLAPVFKALIGPAKVYSKVTGAILAVLAWPFKAVWGMTRRPKASSPSAGDAES